MKKIVKLILAGTFLTGLLAAFLLPGCSDATKARVDVAKKTVLEKIDDMLGKMDVQKAEIDNNIKSAKQYVSELRKQKAKAEFNLQQLDEKVQPFKDAQAKYEERLAILRDSIKSDMPADFGGKTLTVAQMKELAGELIKRHKEAGEKIQEFQRTRESLQKDAAKLAQDEQTYSSRITKLQAAVSKLDSEIALAKSKKEAVSKMGGGTLEENLDELERKIADLTAEVKGETASVTGGISATECDKTNRDVEAFLKATEKPADPVAEIDAILGKKK